MSGRALRFSFFLFIIFYFYPSFAVNDSATYVTKFEFTGIKRTPQEDLKKISAKYIHSPLIGNWPDQMIQEIEKIPVVKEAYVIRDLTGKVTIRIVEKKPMGYLALEHYYWIDETGQIIQDIPTGQLESMVFFSGPWSTITEYKKKDGISQISKGLALYMNLLSEGFEEKKISEIHFDANLGWMMYRVESRAPVVFGTDDLPQKVERFVQVTSQLDPLEGEIVKIDADFHDRVVVKLASSPSQGSK